MWDKLNERYLTLNPRERGLIGATTFVFVAALLLMLVIEPAEKQQSRAAQQLTATQTNLDSQRAAMNLLDAARQKDPSAPAREAVEALIREDQQITQQLAALSEVLMDPAQMTDTLRRLLNQHPGIEVVSIENLPVQNLQASDRVAPKDTEAKADDAGDQADQNAPIYRHGVELVLVGDFDALYRYLFAAEQNAKAFFWDSVEIEQEEYPRNRMTLRVHTLSGEEGWLGG